MSQYTPLNIEQSIAKYLSEQFQDVLGAQIYWHDTEQTEGSGSTEITLLRSFPKEPGLLINQDDTRVVGTVKVPAFAVFVDQIDTRETDRMGIGESVFEWNASIRIDGFVDTEYQWYIYYNLLKDWFHVDTRVDLYDYQDDLDETSPTALSNKMHLSDSMVLRRELDFTSAARYYLFLSTSATYIE